MIEKKGLFYEFEYYLLPDDVSSVAELEEKYGHRAFETVRYEQKTCMAPYVTGESERIETISDERLFARLRRDALRASAKGIRCETARKYRQNVPVLPLLYGRRRR